MKNYQPKKGRLIPSSLGRVSTRWCSKLLVLLLCMVSLNTFAQQSKSYTFDFKNASYENVLKQITDQTGVHFFYSNADLKSLNPLTLSVANAELATVLSKVFSGTGLGYETQDNGTVVIKKATAKTDSQQVAASQPQAAGRTVKGVVSDAKDKTPLPYVVVTSKDVPNFYTSADDAGKFSATLPANVKTLTFSLMGYNPVEVAVGTQSLFTIELAPDALALDETVVVGYQTRKKSTLTGSVKALDGSVVGDKPVASFDKSLQGQAAGVYVMSNGAPGSSSNVLIRGVASANYNVQPLYILDGTIISSNSFATLNPNDIDQLTVLKDASATSIYGSLAAHGVVLITSKRGRDIDRPEINYRFQLGTSMLAEQNFTMMNTSQRLQYEEELGMRKLDASGRYYINPNGTLVSKDSLMLINTNWNDEIFKMGAVQSHDLSMRGGSQNTRYFASLNYYSQDGILPSSSFDRYTFRINLDQNVTKYLKVGTSTTLGREFKEETPSGAGNLYNPVVASYALLPYYKPYNDDGDPVRQFNGTDLRNPLLYYQLSEIKNDKIKMVTNLYAELKLFPFLTFKSSLGYDYQDRSGHTYTSPQWDGSGSISRLYAKDQSLTNTNLFTFKQSFGKEKKHNLNVLLGEEYLMSNDESYSFAGTGLATDKAQSIRLANTFTPGPDVYAKWTMLSFFSQASYNYENKYFLDLSLREDGSSRFGADNKWGTFWSVGASWNAKREKFLEDSKLITALNVYASTGTSGNSNIGAYDSYALYSYGGNYSYNGNIGSAPLVDNPGNTSLAWETVWKNNLGVEATFLGKYRFKVETFRNLTSNMLFLENLSLTSGFENRSANMGKMTNTGLEFEWDITLLKTKDIQWRFNGNASYTVSKMKDMAEPMVSTYIMYEQGKRYGVFFMSKYAGTDPLNGKPLWYDVNGNLTDVYTDANRVKLGKSFIPPYTGGFGSDFTYKRLSASVFFSWVADRYMLNNGSKFYNSNGALKEYNQSERMLDYWKTPGDYTPYSAPVYANNRDDTRYLENASFLRLKNITISYTLDPEYLKKTKLIRGARIYIQAENLFTFTPYTGYDPENISPVEGNVYPQSRMFTFGLDLNF